jgi:hypothetical protein
MDQRLEDLAMNRTLSALAIAAVLSAAGPAMAAERP